MNSHLSKLISRSLMWTVGPLSKTHVLGRWPWLEAEEELSARRFISHDLREIASKVSYFKLTIS